MNMLSLLDSLLTLALVCAPTWRLLHSFSDVAISDGVLPLDATGAESNESVAKVPIERAADVDTPRCAFIHNFTSIPDLSPDCRVATRITTTQIPPRLSSA
jgi:hypothetical protein